VLVASERGLATVFVDAVTVEGSRAGATLQLAATIDALIGIAIVRCGTGVTAGTAVVPVPLQVDVAREARGRTRREVGRAPVRGAIRTELGFGLADLGVGRRDEGGAAIGARSVAEHHDVSVGTGEDG